MALFPILMQDLFRPSRLLDQHSGMGLNVENLLSPFDTRLSKNCPGNCLRSPSDAQTYCGSTINTDKDKCQVSLDVQQFLPEEVTVKVDDKNTITVEGKHEEKQDEHGSASRQFVRKYVLPDGHDINNIVSSLSSDGVLSITAPRLKKNDSEDRTIPIQQTGVPSKPITNKNDKKQFVI